MFAPGIRMRDSSAILVFTLRRHNGLLWTMLFLRKNFVHCCQIDCCKIKLQKYSLVQKITRNTMVTMKNVSFGSFLNKIMKTLDFCGTDLLNTYLLKPLKHIQILVEIFCKKSIQYFVYLYWSQRFHFINTSKCVLLKK